MEFTLKDFLVEGGEGSGRPDDGKRPKNSLWFSSPFYWYADMKNKHGGTADLSVINQEGEDTSIEGENGEEVAIRNDSDLYVVDPDRKVCYGVWKKNYRRGITFERPRSLAIVMRRQ